MGIAAGTRARRYRFRQCRFLNRLGSPFLNASRLGFEFGPNPLGSILPPSDRGRRLGRRSRSFLVRTVPDQWRRTRRGDPACSRLCKNRSHGTDLVRADVHPPAWQGRGRRGGSLSGGRRADRSRDHRRDRHLLPPRRHAAAQGQGRSIARRARRSCPSSLEDAFVLDGPGEYEVKDVLLTGRPDLPR